MIYIGMTNDLSRRMYEHKNKLVDGYTKKYNIDQLVYFENYTSPIEAIAREKQLKNWSRVKKMTLIKSNNPNFEEISQTS